MDQLKPRPGFLITPIIIFLNTGIFLLMAFMGLGFIGFESIDLVHWGANFGPYVREGQWWRLLTSTFLHGGVLHLFMNMYGLFYIGGILEPILGKTKFLVAYLLSGIIASAASIWWHEAVPSVGASGAIFGMYGLFLALLLRKIFPPEIGKALLSSTLFFIGFNLLIGTQGNIDNAAHIGGLVIGFLIGIIFSFTLPKLTLVRRNEYDY